MTSLCENCKTVTTCLELGCGQKRKPLSEDDYPMIEVRGFRMAVWYGWENNPTCVDDTVRAAKAIVERQIRTLAEERKKKA